MTKIWPQLGLNVSCRATDDLLESDHVGRNVENCTRTDSAFSGTLWGISHD
jgi:hypothetical protein